MTIPSLSHADMDFLLEEAKRFKRETRWIMPSIFNGNHVAHERNAMSQITNFSTITRLVTLPSGFKAFLVHRYALSWMHTLMEHIWRFFAGVPARKPYLTSTWQETFESKSNIDIIPLNIPGMVAMPYIPNWNLRDALVFGTGEYSDDQLVEILFRVCGQINTMHARGRFWGQLIVHNILIGYLDSPTICDTETEFLPGTSAVDKAMHDWREFIFSAVGAWKQKPADLPCCCEQIEVITLTKKLMARIEDTRVAMRLKTWCDNPRTIGQKIFWQGFGGAVGCSDAVRYELIRTTIANS